MKINDMNLVRTEYAFDCAGKNVKTILSYQEGKARIDVFLEGDRVYYYIIERFTELSMDDVELVETIVNRINEDKNRWIKDCTFIEDNSGKLKLLDKTTVYEITFPYTVYTLKAITIDTPQGYVFKLEYLNNKNSDILSCYVESFDKEEMLAKVIAYAETIASISSLFIEHSAELSKNAFSKCFN